MILRTCRKACPAKTLGFSVMTHRKIWYQTLANPLPIGQQPCSLAITGLRIMQGREGISWHPVHKVHFFKTMTAQSADCRVKPSALEDARATLYSPKMT